MLRIPAEHAPLRRLCRSEEPEAEWIADPFAGADDDKNTNNGYDDEPFQELHNATS